ncbi:MAG: hypothetical protein LBQ81_13155 [Zoogloeaceae bacterium]|jgi:hypothetical protein|nr:hypothetical protein [Zoogloeaceae bacterium]
MMRRKIYFCKSWFMAKKMPTEVWTKEQALAAHKSGKPYAVLVDSQERPSCCVEVTKNYVGVDFLDEHLRDYLVYVFQRKQESEKLFLSRINYTEYDGNSDRIKFGTLYLLKPDGSVKVSRETFIPEHCLETMDTSTDVSVQYETFPEFGEYDAFLKIERG